jgi:diacylglycerol kinase family enzyme
VTVEDSYLFVINPISGGTDKKILRQFIEEESRKSAITYSIYETTGKNDGAAILRLLQEGTFGVVVAAGGDGTVMLVAQVLMDRPERLGIIPLGSANGLAKELGLLRTLDPVRSLITRERIRKAWSVIQHGHVLEMDAIRIQEKHLSLHLSDIGLNAKIVKRFEKDKLRGFRGYARQFFREIPLRERIYYRIQTDDRDYRGHAYMIVIANATMYGSGAVINRDGKIDDGKVELCIVKDITLKGLLKAMLSIFKKDVSYEKKDLKVVGCTHATISLRRKQTLQVDGEVVGETAKVKVEVLHHCVRVLVNPD